MATAFPRVFVSNGFCCCRCGWIGCLGGSALVHSRCDVLEESTPNFVLVPPGSSSGLGDAFMPY
jgi:hypothetical protein